MARSSAVAFDWQYYLIDGLHRNQRWKIWLDLDGIPSDCRTWAGLAVIVQPNFE